MATITYAISTMLAMNAAVAPARVELPTKPAQQMPLQLFTSLGGRPRNIVCSVKKYVPIGPAIIAIVKPNNLYMTALWKE